MIFAEYIDKAEAEGRLERCYCNKIEFFLVTESDGWISVFRRCDDSVYPLIQAADKEHAISYCSFVEPADLCKGRIDE